MNLDKFTYKINKALAHELAMSHGHAQFTPLHVAVALMSDSSGLFRQAISNAAGGSDAANSVQRKALGDGHLAVDQLILGLFEDSEINDLLKEARVAAARVKAETYGRDLVEQAGKLDPVNGRDSEIRRVIRILSRRTKNNPVLIGELGVGKTAVVQGLAQRIVRSDVPSNLADVRLIALDMGA
ncbi:hypothetical protein Ancab_036027 [Ancistrocladus abbreviatus]